jgi:hypothetical protein
MSNPPPAYTFPLADQGNGLLAHVPCVWATGIAQGYGLVTIRTATTTLTVIAARKQDVLAWAKMLADLAGQMSDTGLVTGPGTGITPGEITGA